MVKKYEFCPECGGGNLIPFQKYWQECQCCGWDSQPPIKRQPYIPKIFRAQEDDGHRIYRPCIPLDPDSDGSWSNGVRILES